MSRKHKVGSTIFNPAPTGLNLPLPNGEVVGLFIDAERLHVNLQELDNLYLGGYTHESKCEFTYTHVGALIYLQLNGVCALDKVEWIQYVVACQMAVADQLQEHAERLLCAGSAVRTAEMRMRGRVLKDSMVKQIMREEYPDHACDTPHQARLVRSVWLKQTPTMQSYAKNFIDAVLQKPGFALALPQGCESLPAAWRKK